MNPQYAAINSGESIDLAFMTVIGKGDEAQPAITHLISTTSIDQAKAKILESKISGFSYVSNQADAENTTDAIIYIVDRFSTPGQLEQTKTELSLSNDYTVGYFNFDSAAMFCALPKETIDATSKTLKDFYEGSSRITCSELGLTHLYLRVYPQNNCSAIINFSESHVSIVVIEKASPIWVTALTITDDDSIATAVKLLNEFGTSVPTIPVEKILICGHATRTHLEALEEVNRSKSVVVEFFNPLFNNFISTSLLSQTQLNLLEREGHRFAIVIGVCLMMTENAGIDLSVNQERLVKSFRQTPMFHVPFNIRNSLVEVSTIVKTKVLAAATSQSKLIALGLVIAVALVSYNYYETNNRLTEIDNGISTETKIATQLKPFEDRYKEYQRKLAVKNSQIAQIRDIQKNQLTVPTILDALQRAQTPLQQLVNFSSIEIENRSLKVTGNAIDKAQTISLLEKLRNSDNARFLDINPTYSSSDVVRCEFSFTANYGGPVQTNPIKLPVSTSSNQIAQIPNK